MAFSLIPSEPSGAKSPTFAKVLAWGLGLGTAVAIAPFVFLAIKGAVGFLFACAIGYFSLRMAPAFGMITSHLVLKIIRWEARRNPIETKMDIFKDDKAEADQLEKETQTFCQEVEAYRTQVEKLAKTYPEEALQFRQELKDYEEQLAHRYAILADLRDNLVLQQKDIERAVAIWDMTKSNDRMNKIAGRLSQRDATRQIMESEANKAIEDGRARSRAALIHLRETQAGRKPATLPAPSTPELLIPDANNVYAAQPAHVPVQQRKA